MGSSVGDPPRKEVDDGKVMGQYHTQVEEIEDEALTSTDPAVNQASHMRLLEWPQGKATDGKSPEPKVHPESPTPIETDEQLPEQQSQGPEKSIESPEVPGISESAIDKHPISSGRGRPRSNTEPIPTTCTPRAPVPEGSASTQPQPPTPASIPTSSINHLLSLLSEVQAHFNTVGTNQPAGDTLPQNLHPPPCPLHNDTEKSASKTTSPIMAAPQQGWSPLAQSLFCPPPQFQQQQPQQQMQQMQMQMQMQAAPQQQAQWYCYPATGAPVVQAMGQGLPVSLRERSAYMTGTAHYLTSPPPPPPQIYSVEPAYIQQPMVAAQCVPVAPPQPPAYYYYAAGAAPCYYYAG
ncbi:hypothetical protein GGS20DRAFT_598110 [Poronia punctata]|nr:hypothetical protein GGS20DRAFT_598110 [Poronia punctata]